MKNKKNGNFLFFCRKSKKEDFINNLRSLGIVGNISTVKKPQSREISFKNDILLFSIEVREASTRRKLNKLQDNFL